MAMVFGYRESILPIVEKISPLEVDSEPVCAGGSSHYVQHQF
jgi:hypothetical protein